MNNHLALNWIESENMRVKCSPQPALIYVWESVFSQYSAGIFKDCFNTHGAVCPLSHREKLCSELHCVGCVIEFPAMHPAEKVGCKTALEAETSPCGFLTCSLWFTAPLLGFNFPLCAQSLPLCPPLTTFTRTENTMGWWQFKMLLPIETTNTWRISSQWLKCSLVR